MPPPLGLKLLPGDTAVDIEAMRRKVTVELDTDAAEHAYQEKDWRLHLMIQGVAGAEFGPERASTLVSVHEDWFPNRTKSISCDQSAVSARLVAALQSLLKGEFSEWSLAIEVYDRSSSKELEVGPIKVYADAIFAVQALGALLASGA